MPVNPVMAEADLTWGPGDCIYGAGLLQIAMTARQEPPRVPQQAQMVRYGGLTAYRMVKRPTTAPAIPFASYRQSR